MEYDPKPPFNAGIPATAGEDIVQLLLKFGQPLIEAFLQQTQDVPKF